MRTRILACTAAFVTGTACAVTAAPAAVARPSGPAVAPAARPTVTHTPRVNLETKRGCNGSITVELPRTKPYSWEQVLVHSADSSSDTDDFARASIQGRKGQARTVDVRAIRSKGGFCSAAWSWINPRYDDVTLGAVNRVPVVLEWIGRDDSINSTVRIAQQNVYLRVFVPEWNG